MIRYFNWTKVKYWMYYNGWNEPSVPFSWWRFLHFMTQLYTPVVHFVIQIPAVYVVSCSVLQDDVPKFKLVTYNFTQWYNNVKRSFQADCIRTATKQGTKLTAVTKIASSFGSSLELRVYKMYSTGNVYSSDETWGQFAYGTRRVIASGW